MAVKETRTAKRKGTTMSAKITMMGLLKLNESGPEGKLMVNAIIHQAFSLVENRKDWKGPIDQTLRMDCNDFTPEVIMYAVSYMTATHCDGMPLPEGQFRFVSIGYRAGPAA